VTRTIPLLVVGLAVARLLGAEAASAFISANTIDQLATYRQGGTLVRVTGPISCTRGERVAIRVAVRQPAAGASTRGRWKGRCTGEVQHISLAVRWRSCASVSIRPR
jgi:hypothetical protein